MRLNLNPFQPADSRVRLAPDPGDTARCLHVVAAIDHVVAIRSVGRDDKRAVPQLAVKMFGVIAFHPLPATKTHVERPPRRQECREGSHILGRCAATAKRYGEARKSAFIHQAAGANIAHPTGDRIKRFIP